MLMQADGWLHDARSRDLPWRLERARADLDLVDKLEVNRMSRAGLFHDRSDLVSVAQGYATAFQQAGLIVSSDQAGVQIRESPIREELVAALDDWALVTPDASLRVRLLQVARLADPDPTWRDRVRDPTVWRNRQALERLARQALGVMGAVSPPQLLTTLGVLLKQAGGDPEPLLRVAQQLRPTDLWFNYELGHVLRAEKPDEAIGFCRAALVIRPRSSAVHDNLGSALAAAGRLEEAIKSYYTAIDLDSKNSAPHNNLGTVYWKMGRVQEAAKAYHEAIALNPRNSAAYHNLGNILAAAGQVAGAIGAYRRSIELNPDQGGWPRSHWRDSFWGKAGSPRPAPRSSSASGKALSRKRCAPVLSRDSSFVTGSSLSAIACRPFSMGVNRPLMLVCCADLALFCQHAKKWQSAAHFFAAAFKARPSLADDLATADRYNAACYATLAGCGQGAYDQPITSAERARLRCQARDWLWADLALAPDSSSRGPLRLGLKFATRSASGRVTQTWLASETPTAWISCPPTKGKSAERFGRPSTCSSKTHRPSVSADVDSLDAVEAGLSADPRSAPSEDEPPQQFDTAALDESQGMFSGR